MTTSSGDQNISVTYTVKSEFDFMLRIIGIFLIIFLSVISGLLGQVSISTLGSTPDESAVLDVASSNKGMLIPRLSTAERVAVSNPAKGLIVLDTTRMAFYYYDGVEKWIQLATGSVNYDSLNNQVLFDQNILFTDSVEIYDDLKVPVNSLKVQGSNNQPTWTNIASFTGTLAAYHFDPDVLQQLFFVVQLPHSYKPGTAIYPHVHWMPSGSSSGDVIWGLEYTWASIGNSFGSTTVITGSGTVNSSELNKHIMTSIGNGIDGTGQTESSMIICRMFRAASDAGDTYPEQAVLLELDLHYRVEKVGGEFTANP